MKTLSLELENRDRIQVDYSDSGEVTNIKANGCLDLLGKVRTIKAMLPCHAEKLFLFHDQGHANLMLNEAMLKVLNKWKYPYQEEELCHCRAIPAAKVDAAIVAGCHDVEEIAEETSAGTACGTCRTDSQNCITYRLKDPVTALRE